MKNTNENNLEKISEFIIENSKNLNSLGQNQISNNRAQDPELSMYRDYKERIEKRSRDQEQDIGKNHYMSLAKEIYNTADPKNMQNFINENRDLISSSNLLMLKLAKTQTHVKKNLIQNLPENMISDILCAKKDLDFLQSLPDMASILATTMALDIQAQPEPDKVHTLGIKESEVKDIITETLKSLKVNEFGDLLTGDFSEKKIKKALGNAVKNAFNEVAAEHGETLMHRYGMDAKYNIDPLVEAIFKNPELAKPAFTAEEVSATIKDVADMLDSPEMKDRKFNYWNADQKQAEFKLKCGKALNAIQGIEDKNLKEEMLKKVTRTYTNIDTVKTRSLFESIKNLIKKAFNKFKSIFVSSNIHSAHANDKSIQSSLREAADQYLVIGNKIEKELLSKKDKGLSYSREGLSNSEALSSKGLSSNINQEMESKNSINNQNSTKKYEEWGNSTHKVDALKTPEFKEKLTHVAKSKELKKVSFVERFKKVSNSSNTTRSR